MRDNLSIYQIWAPDHALWTPWAKPVLFANMWTEISGKVEVPKTDWISQPDYATAIIVDLPGGQGVLEGLALARLGYRPVPLYNGVFAPATASMIVPVREIVTTLSRGADELAALNIRPDAPPAFLLDSGRMDGFGKQPGRYDNRWCVFPQDMPSASFLRRNGIQNVVVRSDRIQNDLSHITCRYREEGIRISLHNGKEEKEVNMTKPSEFRSLMYRFKVILGLTRNAAGGCGGSIPEPTQGGSGTRYYGLG